MAALDPELDVAATSMVAESARFVVVGGFGLAEIHGELPLDPIPGVDN